MHFMSILSGCLLFLATVAFMEGVAYVSHRWVMHGFGWFLHKSHHEARTGFWELNDWYFVMYALPSIALLIGGTAGLLDSWSIWVGAGIAAYGDRKSTRLNSSHVSQSRMPSSA